MRSLFQIFLTCATTGLCYGQLGFADIAYPSPDNIKFERLPSLSVKQLAVLKPSIEGFTDSLGILQIQFENHSQELAHNFKLIDFSGDGILDLVFAGFIGAEEGGMFLWIGDGSRFKYIQQIWGTPMLLKKNDKGALSFVVRSGLCCAGYIGDYTLYMPILNSHWLKYEPRKVVREFAGLKLPRKVVGETNFLTIDSGTHLRLSPEIIDSLNTFRSAYEEVAVYGNILAMYPRGSKGIEVAMETDKFGKQWSFVLLDSKNKTVYTRFLADELSFVSGWIESKWLKKNSR